MQNRSRHIHSFAMLAFALPAFGQPYYIALTGDGRNLGMLDEYFDGFSADAISTERAARWADPAGGYFHAMHPALWGGFTQLITGKDTQGEVIREGG